jgi:hypothetical protein
LSLQERRDCEACKLPAHSLEKGNEHFDFQVARQRRNVQRKEMKQSVGKEKEGGCEMRCSL